MFAANLAVSGPTLLQKCNTLVYLVNQPNWSGPGGRRLAESSWQPKRFWSWS